MSGRVTLTSGCCINGAIFPPLGPAPGVGVVVLENHSCAPPSPNIRRLNGSGPGSNSSEVRRSHRFSDFSTAVAILSRASATPSIISIMPSSAAPNPSATSSASDISSLLYPKAPAIRLMASLIFSIAGPPRSLNSEAKSANFSVSRGISFWAKSRASSKNGVTTGNSSNPIAVADSAISDFRARIWLAHDPAVRSASPWASVVPAIIKLSRAITFSCSLASLTPPWMPILSNSWSSAAWVMMTPYLRIVSWLPTNVLCKSRITSGSAALLNEARSTVN